MVSFGNRRLGLRRRTYWGVETSDLGSPSALWAAARKSLASGLSGSKVRTCFARCRTSSQFSWTEVSSASSRRRLIWRWTRSLGMGHTSPCGNSVVRGLYPWGEESQAERVGANPGTMATAQIAAAMGTKRESFSSPHSRRLGGYGAKHSPYGAPARRSATELSVACTNSIRLRMLPPRGRRRQTRVAQHLLRWILRRLMASPALSDPGFRRPPGWFAAALAVPESRTPPRWYAAARE